MQLIPVHIEKIYGKVEMDDLSDKDSAIENEKESVNA